MAKVSTGGGGNTGAGRTQGRRNRKEVAETASSTKENGRQKRGGIKDMKTKESVFCKKGPCGLFSLPYFIIFRDDIFQVISSFNSAKCCIFQFNFVVFKMIFFRISRNLTDVFKICYNRLNIANVP